MCSHCGAVERLLIPLALQNSDFIGNRGGLNLGASGAEEIAGHCVLEGARGESETDGAGEILAILKVASNKTTREGVAATESVDDLNGTPRGLHEFVGRTDGH
jgi:hypothetical protein